MKTLFIVDASGYLYRSYHAIGNMTNSQGESTNALFGFIRSLLKLRKEFGVEYLVAVFDGPDNSKKRRELYPDYKANRAKMPDDLGYQIGWARKACELMGISTLNIAEVEADDTMGSVATWAVAKEEPFETVYLCTSDKDMAQLVNGKIKLLNTHKENIILGAAEVEETYGVPPKKIVDFLAITGDSSDNVPGLPGFGAKTATLLLQQFDSLDEILKHPEQIPGKKKQETVANQSDKALMSRELVTIDITVTIPQEESFFAIKTGEVEELKTFYQKMGFKSLFKELDSTTAATNDDRSELSYTLVDDSKAFEELIAHLSKEKELCFDTETTSPHPMRADLVGVGFAVKAAEAWYIPANGNLGKERLLKGIKPLLENPAVGIYGHNIKYDLLVMGNVGITIANITFDTIIASYLLNSHSRSHSLDTLALDYFGKVKIATGELLGKGKQAVTMAEVPIPQVAEYCCEDVDYSCRLKELLEKALKERRLTTLFQTLELPLLPVLARMERKGVFVDLLYLETMKVKVVEELQVLKEKIFAHAGEVFNPNSPKQLSAILFDKMGITPPKKTATGFSTNAEVLQTLKDNHPIAELLLDYRTLEKLRSTYIEALPLEVNTTTSRIHCTFNQFTTATGRLSSHDPNLQNIPVRSKVGREIRRAFLPQQRNWSFLAADYSQIELRLLAHFSQDPNLIAAFNAGEDIHAHTAAAVFGVEIAAVTKEMRYRAKAVNFGVIYGQQAFGLSKELGVSIKEAQAFIDTYFERYPRILNYIEECKELARQKEKVFTYTGRERALPEINSKNPQIRAAAERLAVNTPLQGSAADLIKKAMIEIDKTFKKEQFLGAMILQIHDELIFEMADFELPTAEMIIKTLMEQAWSLTIPLIVNTKVGKNWKEC